MKIHRSYMYFAYLSLFVMGVSDNIRGPIFPDMIKQFDLSQSKASLFFSLCSITNIIGGYSCSIFFRHIGRMNTLRFSHFLLSLSFLGVWLAPSFNMILVCMFFYGIAIGIMGVAQNVMVVEASPLEQHQKWLSGFQSMYGLASLTSPLLVSISHQYSPAWQTSFFINAIFGFILFFFSFFGSEKKSSHQVEEKHEKSSAHRFEIYYYAIIFAVYVASEVMVSSRLAQFVREESHWSLEATNTLNSFFFLSMFLGRVLFIFWHPRISLKSQMLFSVGVGSVSVVAGAFIHPIIFIFTGLAIAPFYPLCMTAAARLFNLELNRVTSHAMALTGLTVVIMQTAVGAVTENYGIKLGLLVGPIFGLMTIIMILSYSTFFKRKIP